MKRRLGLLVRPDLHGGLGIQTRDLLAHLEPEAALVMQMGGAGRGAVVSLPYPAITYQWAQAAVMDAFLDAIDVLLSVETFYEPYLVAEAERRGIERVLYANPELLNSDDPAERADRYLYPALWEFPFPVPGEVLAYPTPDFEPNSPRRRPGPPRLLHVCAPAMNDRDGRNVLLGALPLITEPVHLDIYGAPTAPRHHPAWVTVTWHSRVDDRRDLYRDADLLVLPRRYGCLSLPMLEAAAAGVPTLTTRLAPQSQWFGEWPELLINPGPSVLVPMKGNREGIPVHQPDPAALARAIDALATEPDRLSDLGRAMRRWAGARSWANLRPMWDAALR